MSAEFLKSLMEDAQPKQVVIAGAAPSQVSEEQLPFATLGTIFNMAPNDCDPQQLGEAIVVAAHSLAEDTETDSTVRFDQLVDFVEQALRTAKALHNDSL